MWFRPLQISRRLARDRTRAFDVGDRRPTAWARAPPSHFHCILYTETTSLNNVRKNRSSVWPVSRVTYGLHKKYFTNIFSYTILTGLYSCVANSWHLDLLLSSTAAIRIKIMF
jgi:hypothetical protein